MLKQNFCRYKIHNLIQMSSTNKLNLETVMTDNFDILCIKVLK